MIGFLVGLFVGILFVFVIGFFLVTSSIDYVKTNLYEMFQTSMDQVKGTLKALESGYEISSLTPPTSGAEEDTHAHLMRMIMATTNWSLEQPIDHLLPEGMTIHDTIDRYGLVYRYGDSTYIVFRGSLYSEDFDKDIEAAQLHPEGYPEDCRIHSGFYHIWRQLRPKLQYILHTLPTRKVYISGYSLGAILALLTSHLFREKSELDLSIYLYGTPRCGNYSMMRYIQKNYPAMCIVNNKCDVVPSMPTNVYGSILSQNKYYYADVPTTKYINVQTGNMFSNHWLTAYMAGLAPGAPETSSLKLLWNETTDHH